MKTTNMMKMIALCAIVSLTGCAQKGSSSAGTATPATADTAVSSSELDDLKAQRDDLYQQENAFFAEHDTAWNKAFGMSPKENADPSGNYAEFLSVLVDSNKEEFTEEELNTLHEDIEKIRDIEDKIAEIEKKISNAENTTTSASSDDSATFANISGTDFDGKAVDGTLFSENAVTVVNFWFSGCKPCVAELSKLNEMNEAVKSMGGEVIGVNTDTFDGNSSAIEEAKKILESQSAKYRNLSVASDCDLGKYASTIMAFPTTVLVDRKGNIVGKPFLGGVDNQDNYDDLMKQIQSVIEADKK